MPVSGMEDVMATMQERKARCRRKEAVLRRVLSNTDLMRQIEVSLDALNDGESAIPFSEVRREPKAP